MDTAKITQNITTELEQLKKYTSTPEKGITRFPFTQEAKEAANYLAQLMTEVGLKVRTDNTGSIIGRLEGKSCNVEPAGGSMTGRKIQRNHHARLPL